MGATSTARRSRTCATCARVRDIAGDLVAAARRTDRPALGGLFLRDPRAIAAGQGNAPSLDEYRERVDPSGDFYTEAELQDLWRDEFGSLFSAANGDEKSARAAEARARLLQRIREGLSWIESKIFPVPQPEHRLDAWLPLAYAERLTAAGLVTIGALTERINRGGTLWYRGIRGFGATKAG